VNDPSTRHSPAFQIAAFSSPRASRILPAIVLPSWLTAAAERPPISRAPDVGSHANPPPSKYVPTTANAFAPTSEGSASGDSGMKKISSSAAEPTDHCVDPSIMTSAPAANALLTRAR
jgi:hypothetical protein